MSTRRSNLVFVGLILAALIGVALLAIPGSPAHKSPRLGLDLQGGLEVVLQAQPPKGRQLTDADLDRSVTVIRDRIDKLGVSETEVRKQGKDQIVIQLPGVTDPDRATKIIGKTAQLELYKFEANLLGPSRNAQGDPVPNTSIFNLLAGQQSLIKNDNAREWYLFDQNKKRVAGPLPTKAEILKLPRVKKQLKAGELPNGWKFMGVPEGQIVLTCGVGERYCPGVAEAPPTQNYFYLLRYQPNDKENPVPEMTGSDLKLSGTRQDFGQNGEPIVLMDFTSKGAKKFHEVTRDIVNSSRIKSSQGRGKVLDSFAIVLDGEIKSAPTVDPDENPDGIPGDNGAQITGIGDIGEAKDLALVLQTGALPIEFQQVDRTDVSATLGRDSLKEAEKAAIAGLVVVALFLLLFYRLLGVVAVVGLGIYAAFLYAAILILDVTLTLPGFAGMILTIGVAADANVVIFERIKEEARAGRSVRAAISTGYKKGFNTIIDANVVTAITALVLFAVATAGVKGFALMLLVGTAISLNTAEAATRAMLALLANFSWFENPSFMGAAGQQKGRWLQIDFVGKRRIWFAIAGAVVAISILSLAVRGLNLGIDFKGGTQVTFTSNKPETVGTVADVAKPIAGRNAVVQGRGNSADGKYRGFQIRAESLTTAEQQQLRTQLEDDFGAASLQVQNVSESFGRQIANSAILAIIVSLLLIVLYTTIRFDFKYAIPILVALAHDVLITIGIYSLTGREVTTSTVAAVLTVLGYSIYDTIIIFDRIRENVPLMRRSSFGTIANVSLWETVRRSLATTFITLLPVGSLLLFGGDTLKDFAFALLIGIGSGAYSSIFIAAPLLAWWKEREPEYARRKGMVGDVVVEGGVGALDAQPVAPQPAAPEPVAPVATAAPVGGDGAAPEDGAAAAAARREKRRQRRRARPHGRAR
jgi:SecD/SecF fusion protein